MNTRITAPKELPKTNNRLPSDFMTIAPSIKCFIWNNQFPKSYKLILADVHIYKEYGLVRRPGRGDGIKSSPYFYMWNLKSSLGGNMRWENTELWLQLPCSCSTIITKFIEPTKVYRGLHEKVLHTCIYGRIEAYPYTHTIKGISHEKGEDELLCKSPLQTTTQSFIRRVDKIGMASLVIIIPTFGWV